MQEQSPRSQTQGLTGGQITENAVNITEPTQVPNLKPKELQAIQLLHQPREKGNEVSRTELVGHLYPEESFQIASIKLRGVLDGAGSRLRPFGWKIDHPLHYSQGKLRRVRDRYVITRLDKVLKVQPSQSSKKHEVLVEKGRNPKKGHRIRSSGDSISTLPHTQDIKLLPTSATIWGSQEIEQRRKIEELEILRQELSVDITLNVLSLIRANEMGELKKIAKETSRGHLPGGVSFDSVIGVDPKEDKETKERKKKEFAVTAVNEALNRLWGKQLKLVTMPKERQILTICIDLEETGKTIQDIKNAVSEGLGVDLPKGPTSAMVA